ncbi:acyl-CoA dehydrogenase family protein [Aquisalimonas sp.]|uniref:acyl-CoA dehydrogenase family protein n=1 Tax=Aquisalimonas sp. TaxID=1872621 RepID=UPI0025C3B165|nr:acyl-CoA dehydrogenase family protein [Aquisalimonas sp.]
MDFELNDDQLAFQETAREFAHRELAPNAARWDEQCVFPVETLRLAGELGFCGVYCPEDVGGLGLSRLDATIIFEALAGGCTSTTAYITIHNMATWMVATFGTGAVRESWCPQLTSGDMLASYCLTEPGAGSDAASLRTKAARDGDGYRLNGSKAFISGAGETDLLVVMARTGGSGPSGVTAFAVPADSDGITYGRKEGKMGWNSQPTRGITFEDVYVPAANRLGAEGEGFKIAMRGLDGGRLNVATCSVGTAAAALDASLRYARERKQFGRVISEFQGVQFKLADMATELVAARQMVRLGAARLDAKHPEASTYCAMAKRLATDLGFRICNEALQIHGGYGYIREYPLERHVRDVRVHQILEGTNEIMRVIIARRLLAPGSENLLA